LRAEQKIRQYLVDQNYVETVIFLAPNLFYGIQFINASGEEFFKKETNNNVMYDEHIEKSLKFLQAKAMFCTLQRW